MKTVPGSAAEMLGALRAGQRTASDWTEQSLARIEARNGALKVWSHVAADSARATARALDAKPPVGPLQGMPFGVKDVILTEQAPTGYNSPIYQDFFPRIDAACVKLLRAAGAVMLGKTETVEFAAAFRLAPTHNPLDPARTPGGSSSGSAAAVADGHVPVALGTQTGGSLIRPASYCGVFAMKPTWSRVSRDGIRLYAPTLDTLGWFARSVEDLGLVYDALVPDRLPRRSRAIAGARIALCHTPFAQRAEPSTRAGLTQAAEALARAGAQVSTLTLPPEFDDIDRVHHIIMRAEGRSAFLPEYRADLPLLNEHFRALVENSDGYSDADLRQALDRAAVLRARFDRLAAPFDAVLTYSVPGEAPLGLGNNGSADFNSLWTLLHVPCVNIPAFTGPSGMPVGLTVLGPRFADTPVLEMAAAIHPVLAEARAGAQVGG
ncbi:MAG: amidase [Proteobacteria bacterium]|nr:amidase [Pseudomonadota bacterium]